MTVVLDTPARTVGPRLLWLDLTRACQLSCTHCFNGSGRDGGHGSMALADWLSVLDQAGALGVEEVRLIGGEPTMHPDAPLVVEHACSLGLPIEVFSNLVRVSRRWWELFSLDRVSVATSYYSDQADEHDEITGRRSHARTRANIVQAVESGVRLRVEIIAVRQGQRTAEAEREMRALGVKEVHIAPVMPFGRASHGQAPDPARLCRRCGTGALSVGPDGKVSPCVFTADWMSVGDVHETPLAAIVTGTAITEANAAIRAALGPDDDGDGGSDDDECRPGFPGSNCSPRT